MIMQFSRLYQDGSVAASRRHHKSGTESGRAQAHHHDNGGHSPLDPVDTLPAGEQPEVINGELYRKFPGRMGYDPNFLGAPLPMPQLDESIKDQAAPLLADASKTELKYTHFSVIQNKERRSPLVTAVNVDGAQSQELERKGSWVFDARIAREYQVGNEAYAHNDIDKGHQVRRRDPIWGADALQAGGDTFVYTNSGLQHADLNQRTWLDLENHVLEGAIAKRQKISVFTGPVFADSDTSFNNAGDMPVPTKIPSQFWKVEVWNKPGKGLEGEAFVISQKDLIGKAKTSEPYIHMTPLEIQNHRLPIAKLEEMTHLHFGAIAEAPREVPDKAA